MDQTDAYRFNKRLRACSTLLECRSLFREAIAVHGFTTFACGELDLRDRDRNVFYVTDWPDAWTRFYTKSGFIERDPLIEALANRTDPFTWSDLRAERKLAKVGISALDKAAAEGWTEGLVVPLPKGGNRMGLVSMAGHRLITDPAISAHLVLIGTCLHSHARTLVACEGFAVPPARLTDREIACLRLVARGFSDKGIALSLGIAASTAHEFVEKAKRRLKVQSRPELIALSVSLGIIDI